MTEPREPNGTTPLDAAATARSRAASLLVSAAHLLDATPTPLDGAAQLACLAAADALDAAPALTLDRTATSAGHWSVAMSAQRQIRAALAALGALPAAAFADPRVYDGARYARLALSRLT